MSGPTHSLLIFKYFAWNVAQSLVLSSRNIKHNSHFILQGLLCATLQVPGDLLQPRHLERGGGGGGAQEGGEGTGFQYPGLPSKFAGVIIVLLSSEL